MPEYLKASLPAVNKTERPGSEILRRAIYEYFHEDDIEDRLTFQPIFYEDNQGEDRLTFEPIFYEDLGVDGE
jgi:hypothetical protein